MNQKYNDFSPVIKYGVPDYKRDSPQWYAWLEEQLHYIYNGFTHGGTTISGRLYFKLNFFKLLHIEQDDEREKMISPYYVDAQKDLYDLLDYCYTEQRDLIVGKGRDKGFSYDLANISLYETQFFKDNHIIMLFPSGKSPAKQQFQNKYNLAWQNLLDDFKCDPGLANRVDLYKYGWVETDENTGRKTNRGSLSSITMLEAVDSDIGKSGRFKIMGLEEFGEIKDPLKLIQTSRANLQKGSKKFGTIIAGGTSNAFNNGYKDFRELWFNHDSYGFEKFFIPANKALWGFVKESGESDLEGAEKWVLDRRKGLKDDILTIEMQNYPLTEKEMFVSINNSPFNTNYTSSQIADIMTNKAIQSQIRTGNLYIDKQTNEVKFAECNDGRWKIYLHPKKGLINKDVGAVDPYRKGSGGQFATSKGAVVIYRPFNGLSEIGGLPICIYLNRPKTKDMFFEDCLLTAKYYDCQLLFEHTEDDWADYFIKRNAQKYLKARPNLLDNIYSKNNANRFGVSPTAQAKGTALEVAIQDFDSNWESHVFIELLDELSRFGPDENTDLAMAYIWAVLHAQDNIKLLPEFMPKKKEKPFIPYTINNGNKIIVISSKEQQKMINRL